MSRRPDPLRGRYAVIFQTTMGAVLNQYERRPDAELRLTCHQYDEPDLRDHRRRYRAGMLYDLETDQRLDGWGEEFGLEDEAWFIPIHSAQKKMSCAECQVEIKRGAWYVIGRSPLCLPCGRSEYGERVGV